jgi:hypothetical protein
LSSTTDQACQPTSAIESSIVSIALTARATPGDGLGLSLVAAIARLHDAKVFALDNGPGLKIVVDLAPAP